MAAAANSRLQARARARVRLHASAYRRSKRLHACKRTRCWPWRVRGLRAAMAHAPSTPSSTGAADGAADGARVGWAGTGSAPAPSRRRSSNGSRVFEYQRLAIVHNGSRAFHVFQYRVLWLPRLPVPLVHITYPCAPLQRPARATPQPPHHQASSRAYAYARVRVCVYVCQLK